MSQGERGIIFGALDFEAHNTARILGFNNDGTTPSFGVPPELGDGLIYHSKLQGGKNIVVANVVLRGDNKPSYFLRTFEGMDPIEMDDLDPEEAKRQYEIFIANVIQMVSPEFKVTTDTLREKLEELSRE